MKRIPAWGWAAVVIVALLGLRLACAPPPVEVEVARALRGPIEDAVTNSQAGTVRSRLRARLGFETAGRVVEVAGREGTVVKRGAVVVRLDPVTERAQRDVATRDSEAARAALESARAAAALARAEFDRVDQLHRQAVAARETWDQARSRWEAAQAEERAAAARLERSRAAVRLADDALGHLEVRAPFDGVVTERWVEAGESVIPGQAAIEIMDPDHLYVSTPIDEVDIGRVREGLPARVVLDPYPGRQWRGRVARVSASVDDVREQNRTLEIEVDLEADPRLPRPKPGTSADVEVILDQREHALRVPTFAVIDGRRVLVVSKGRAASRDIVTGLKNWEWTEVRSGISEGDAVVVNLEDLQLKPGTRVRTRERTAAPAATVGAVAPGAGGEGAP